MGDYIILFIYGIVDRVIICFIKRFISVSMFYLIEYLF